MTGANHVAGGLAFTGLFCSLWNVNIFEKPWYLIATVFCALLPDIDHTKSPMGKLFGFTQLPQYLDRNFGHRTITHSLLIYFSLGGLCYLIESIVSTDHTYTLIYFLAYISHLIFDMMTVMGVPLLYPFKKNPCVVPGNPEFRLRVKDYKSEALFFAFFLGLLLFCYPLMQRGFWTTFNRQFGTLSHLHKEYSISDDLLKVEYDYNSKGEHIKGDGLVVVSEKTKAFIFDSSAVFEINDKMKITNILPDHTKQKRKEAEVYFQNIESDSLEILLQDKVILSSDFQSTVACKYWSGGEYKSSQVIKLSNCYNTEIEFQPDTSHLDVLRKLEIKRIELHQLRLQIADEIKNHALVLYEIDKINKEFDTKSLADQEQAVSRLRTLENKKINYHYSGKSTEKIDKQIQQLEAELNENNNTLLSGKITYLVL